MKNSWLLLAVCTISGCATVELPSHEASLIHATVSSPSPTEWERDFCTDGLPYLDSEPHGKEGCMNFGEIYSAKLEGARIVHGGRLRAGIQIAYIAHALPKTYETTEYLVLIPSPSRLRQATGLEYMAGDVGGYDAAHNCIEDRGFSHASWKECRDQSFHARNNDRCVPIDVYLAHYSPGT